MSSGFPAMRSVVLDTLHPRDLAEFYRALLGYSYRPGDEPPDEGAPDPKGADWLVLLAPDGHGRLAFQRVDRLEEPTWPDAAVPQQLHLDLSEPKATVRGGRPGQLLKALGKRAYCAGTRFVLSCGRRAPEPPRRDDDRAATSSSRGGRFATGHPPPTCCKAGRAVPAARRSPAPGGTASSWCPCHWGWGS
jgi:hypothetical protein